MAGTGDQVLKVVLLGNGSVGKSSIIRRLVHDGFERVYQQTVGVDFFERKVEFSGGVRMVLQVWDIGGQSMNSKMLPSYVMNAGALFLVYDVTDADSFSSMDDWHSAVLRAVQAAHARMPHCFLVGNKADLSHLRRVSASDHDRFVEANALSGGFFMSARSGDKVLVSFYAAAARSAGITVSEHDLEALSVVVKATKQEHGDEGRTDIADEIERQDAEAMRKSQQGCGCRVS